KLPRLKRKRDKAGADAEPQAGATATQISAAPSATSAGAATAGATGAASASGATATNDSGSPGATGDGAAAAETPRNGAKEPDSPDSISAPTGLAGRVDGLRAWLAQLDRKLAVRSYAGAAGL